MTPAIPTRSARKTSLAIHVTLALTALAMKPHAQADTLAQWTFETSVPTTAGPFSPEVGAGSALGFHAATSTYSNPVGNGSAESFSSNAWAVGDYYQFQLSTVGYSDIAISFDQTSSGTGPRDFQLAYSTNGSSFTNFGAPYAVLANASPNPVWSSSTYNAPFTSSFDLSSVPALDNQATVYLRLVNSSTVSANGGTVAAAGSNRVDNVTVTAVPEPTTAVSLLGGLGVLLGFRRMRRFAA